MAEKIHELFSDRSKWTQGYFAKDAFGVNTISCSSRACSWCLQGAINKCYRDTDIKFEVREKIRNILGLHSSIAKWNDHPERTFEEVRQLCTDLDI